jgi:nicotinate-nucleotide adenylyltransferase
MTHRSRQCHQRRYGLFGGTFNPIHLGHLRAAEEVREALALERVVFIPSRIPPHKNQDLNDPIAPAKLRLDWVERAIASHENFSIDRIEVDREGPSYLIDTLTTIRDRDSEEALPVFIVGEDAFAEMGDWKSPEALFALTDIAVMTRPPGQMRDLEACFPEAVRSDFEFEEGGRRAWHRKTGRRIDLVPITALDISSSLVREACRAERSLRYLVPESIRSQIESSGEYGLPVEAAK